MRSISSPTFVILNEHGLKLESKLKIEDESKVVKMSNFELRPNMKGIPDKMLIIFHPTDPTLCFKYYFNNGQQYFKCWKCEAKKAHVGAQLHKVSADEEPFIVMGNKEHICEPIKVSSLSKIVEKPKQKKTQKIEERKIVKVPNFTLHPNKDGIPDKRLIIFDPNDGTLCYEYNYQQREKNYVCPKCASKGKYVIAKLREADNEIAEAYIVLGKNDHVCEPSKYELPQIQEIKTVRMPFFELCENTKGVPNRKLIIFHPTDKTLCYEYCFKTDDHTFICNKCKSKKTRVTAKLRKAEDEEEEAFIELGKNDHVCEPSKYQPPIKLESKIVRLPNFKICPSKLGIPDKKMILFHPTDKTLCYEYYFCNTSKAFHCTKCYRMNKHVRAKLQKADDEHDEAYIVLGNIDHICKAVKYKPQ